MCRKNSINNLVADVRKIIESGRGQAYAAASHAAITTYWSVGRRIVEEEQGGQARADYGKGIIKNLAETLVPVYGNSYSKRNLDYYKKFYLLFPDLQIVNACVHNLEWTHVRRILSVTNPNARLWYLENASTSMWSVRELDRNISTQYDSDQLFAAKYMTYMPTEEELRREIEQQKQFFLENHKAKEEKE